MTEDTKKPPMPTDHGTQHYLDARKYIDALQKETLESEDKNSPEFTRWLKLVTVLSSMLDFMAVMFSHINEIRQGTVAKSNKEWPVWKVIVFQGFITLIVFAAGWFFTEIAPRIFSIPHP